MCVGARKGKRRAEWKEERKREEEGERRVMMKLYSRKGKELF